MGRPNIDDNKETECSINIDTVNVTITNALKYNILGTNRTNKIMIKKEIYRYIQFSRNMKYNRNCEECGSILNFMITKENGYQKLFDYCSSCNSEAELIKVKN